MEERERLILFPVRRRLAVLCSAYLFGIYGAQIIAAPAAAFGILCAFLLTTAFLRAKRRKSALLFVAAAFFSSETAWRAEGWRCAMNQVNPAFCSSARLMKLKKKTVYGCAACFATANGFIGGHSLR